MTELSASQIASYLGNGETAQSIGGKYRQAKKINPDLGLTMFGEISTGKPADEVLATLGFAGTPQPMAPKAAPAKSTGRGRAKSVTSASLRKSLRTDRGNGRKSADSAFSEPVAIGTDDDGNQVFISTSVKYGVRVHYGGERGVCLGLPNWLLVSEHIEAIMAEVSRFYS